MINVWQRWKWLLPDLIWNALPVPLNLTDLVTYSLALSDTLLYGLKVGRVASVLLSVEPHVQLLAFPWSRSHTHMLSAAWDVHTVALGSRGSDLSYLYLHNIANFRSTFRSLKS